ncbi:thermonuclease family protein [Neisseria lisongii]|uniref:Thermonuclease family protein n=1 Tax=Neisseria lisongii TaxID=2912188 RepID=A0AAW5AIE6_9NEIS|nr:thermonuclease family protein [Neisseria lisongii]MCF7528754.1 thermonuclease family protein [Neisseria lisongii]MCF7529612.1 thermonuclease family protein [Neisseria lisongii]
MLKRLAALLAVAGALGVGGEYAGWFRAAVPLLEKIAGVGAGQGISEWLTVIRQLVPESEAAAERSRSERPAKTGKYSYSGTVSRVHDGDTLHVIDNSGKKHKIRMAYIDAPEIDQAYGTESRNRLRSAALDKKVRVKVLETDRYQREVAQVLQGQTDLNLMQLQEGAAWHYQAYAKKQQNRLAFADYAAAEKAAKNKRKGLWRKHNPTAPWDFRKQKNAQPQNSGSRHWYGW